MSIARKLKGYREKRGFAKSQMARLVGVSNAQIGRWESGHATPSGKNMLKIIKVLDLSEQPEFVEATRVLKEDLGKEIRRDLEARRISGLNLASLALIRSAKMEFIGPVVVEVIVDIIRDFREDSGAGVLIVILGDVGPRAAGAIPLLKELYDAGNMLAGEALGKIEEV